MEERLSRVEDMVSVLWSHHRARNLVIGVEPEIRDPEGEIDKAPAIVAALDARSEELERLRAREAELEAKVDELEDQCTALHSEQMRLHGLLAKRSECK